MQLPEFTFLLIGQRAKLLFFNKKIYAFPTTCDNQLFEARFEFGSRVEIFLLGHLDRCKFAKVAAFIIMSPTLKQSSRRDIGFFLHCFNEVVQKFDAGAIHVRQFFDIKLVRRRRVVEQQRDRPSYNRWLADPDRAFAPAG